MINKEIVTINNIKYNKTYSDKNFYIERENQLYSEAIDPIDIDREYTETDIPIEHMVETDNI